MRVTLPSQRRPLSTPRRENHASAVVALTAAAAFWVAVAAPGLLPWWAPLALVPVAAVGGVLFAVVGEGVARIAAVTR